MNEHKNIVVSVTDPDGHILRLTMDWDSNITDWIQTFKTILIWRTFGHGSFQDMFVGEED